MVAASLACGGGVLVHGVRNGISGRARTQHAALIAENKALWAVEHVRDSEHSSAAHCVPESEHTHTLQLTSGAVDDGHREHILARSILRNLDIAMRVVLVVGSTADKHAIRRRGEHELEAVGSAVNGGGVEAVVHSGVIRACGNLEVPAIEKNDYITCSVAEVSVDQVNNFEWEKNLKCGVKVIWDWSDTCSTRNVWTSRILVFPSKNRAYLPNPLEDLRRANLNSLNFTVPSSHNLGNSSEIVLAKLGDGALCFVRHEVGL